MSDTEDKKPIEDQKPGGETITIRVRDQVRMCMPKQTCADSMSHFSFAALLAILFSSPSVWLLCSSACFAITRLERKHSSRSKSQQRCQK